MSFRPKGHEKYSVGPYTKFEEGENKFRILREPITGYEYWVDANGQIVERGKMSGEGGKPMRLKEDAKFTNEQIGAMKMFAAMVVWNYKAEKIQILQVKQVKIMNALDGLYDSKDWGDVTDYDIAITKEKTGPKPIDVEYTVLPLPKKAVGKDILEAYENADVNLEALYDGEDPFKKEELPF